MEDILRDQRDLNGPTRRNVQRINLMLAAGMLGLPHPLLAHHVDLHGIGRRIVNAEIKQRAPDKGNQKKTQRDQRPGSFEQRGAFNLRGLRTALLAIAHGEAQHQTANQQQAR